MTPQAKAIYSLVRNARRASVNCIPGMFGILQSAANELVATVYGHDRAMKFILKTRRKAHLTQW